MKFLRLERAFTLIELLVVIAVIGILAALLLPALASAKHKARTVQCLNDFKQLGIAAHVYANDNQDSIPREKGQGQVQTVAVVTSVTNQDVWYNVWPSAVGKSAASDYMDTAANSVMPAFYQPSSLFTCSEARFNLAFAHDSPRFSRAINSRLTATGIAITLNSLTTPSRTPLLLEAGVPDEVSLKDQAGYDGRPHVKWDRSSARHHGFGNMVFGDGSGRAVPAEELSNPTPRSFRWER